MDRRRALAVALLVQLYWDDGPVKAYFKMGLRHSGNLLSIVGPLNSSDWTLDM